MRYRKGAPPPTYKLDIPATALRMRRTRIAMGMTLADMARATGINRACLGGWEHAEGRPGLDSALTLCKTLRLTLDWIYRGDPNGLTEELATEIRRVEHRDP